MYANVDGKDVNENDLKVPQFQKRGKRNILIELPDPPPIRKLSQGHSQTNVVKRIDCLGWWKDNWMPIICGLSIIIAMFVCSMYFFFNCKNINRADGFRNSGASEIRFNLKNTSHNLVTKTETSPSSTSSTTLTTVSTKSFRSSTTTRERFYFPVSLIKNNTGIRDTVKNEKRSKTKPDTSTGSTDTLLSQECILPLVALILSVVISIVIVSFILIKLSSLVSND